MIPLSNPHTHTVYVDGKDTPEALVQAALAEGFVSLGFSEHAAQSFDMFYSLNAEREKQYIGDVLALQSKYKGRIAIYLGLERDALSVAGRSQYEYIIGSCHYADKNGVRVAVDGDPAQLLEFVSTQLHGSGTALAEIYYRNISDYVFQYKPDIIGHFDLVAKHNGTLHLFDEKSPAYLRLAFDSMDKCIQGCDLMEVNTGAMARSGALFPYPSMPLLRHWKTLGGRVILSSDCHNKAHIRFGFEKSLALIREAGFKEIWYLNPQDGPLFINAGL